MSHIVVLGAGTGGMPAAHELREKLGRDHRMIEGFETVYHLEDGRLARVDHHAQVAGATPA